MTEINEAEINDRARVLVFGYVIVLLLAQELRRSRDPDEAADGLIDFIKDAAQDDFLTLFQPEERDVAMRAFATTLELAVMQGKALALGKAFDPTNMK